MPEAMLNLKWDSFSSQLKNSLDSCYEKQYFVDLSLVCKNGAILKCHKMVLSNGSSFFRRLLVKNDHPHPMIILHDIEADDLKTIVNFMYCGEIQVLKSEVKRILKIAETLEVSGLKDIRKTSLISEINDSSKRNPGTSTDAEYSLKVKDSRTLTKPNMEADTSDPIGARKSARIATKRLSNFEERNNDCAKLIEGHSRTHFVLSKKDQSSAHRSDVKTQGSSISGAAFEKTNVIDTKDTSMRKRINSQEQSSWNKILSDIPEEDQRPLKRLYLLDEIEITPSVPSTSRTEGFSQGEESPNNTESAGYSSALESNADCEIYIKKEVDIPSDSEPELDSAAIEEYNCGEPDASFTNRSVEIFKRVRCASGAMSASPKQMNLFELRKKKGSSG